MKIGTRLIVGFLAITALIWVTFFLAVNTYERMHEEFEVLREDVIPTVIVTSDIEVLISRVAHEITDYIHYGEEETKQSILSAIKQLKNKGLTHLEQHTLMGHEEKRVTEELVVKIDTYSLTAVELINLKEQGMSHDQLMEEEEKLCSLSDVLTELIRECEVVCTGELAEAEELLR